MTTDYSWQKQTFGLWYDNKFRGVVKAVTGSGKSYAAINCIKSYRTIYGNDVPIWIVCDYNVLKKQWIELLAEKDLSDIPVYLYPSARAQLLAGDSPQLVILDEAHHLEAKVWGDIMNFGIPHALALSATPNSSCAKVGPVIQKIGFDRAKLASSTTHLVKFDLSNDERTTYDYLTANMRSYRDRMYYEHHRTVTFNNDANYRRMITKRKNYVNQLSDRWAIALNIVKQNLGRRMMLFFSYRSEIETFAAMLDKENIEYAIQCTGHNEISKFDDGLCDILLSINMVSAGYSNPSVEVGIALTYPASPRDAIQKTGRILRWNGDKHADIYYIIAANTMEETAIIDHKETLFPHTENNIITIEKGEDYE